MMSKTGSASAKISHIIISTAVPTGWQYTCCGGERKNREREREIRERVEDERRVNLGWQYESCVLQEKPHIHTHTRMNIHIHIHTYVVIAGQKQAAAGNCFHLFENG